jgi:class 3 adenylate cyclase
VLLRRGGDNARAKAGELIASARQAADALGLVRLQRRLETVEAARLPIAKLRLIEGVAALDAGAEPGGAAQSDAGAIDADVASAMSGARDFSVQAASQGMVVLMFSDVVDSSSIYESLGDLRAHEVIRAHNEILRQQIAAHHGVEVKALGDSFMVAFSSARRAALCAVATQRSFAAYSEAHQDQPLRVRIGLHVGEAISESSDFFGKAVIQAARIAALAQGGQILVSSTFRDLTSGAGDLQFESIGERQLKGLAGAHQIFEVAWLEGMGPAVGQSN